MLSEDKYIFNFIKNGTFPKETVLYFDPPLVGDEMYALKGILDSKNIKNSNMVLLPIEGKYKHLHSSKELVWIRINKNTVSGWQNVQYISDIGLLNNKESYKSWLENTYKNSFHEFKFIDGRKLLPQINIDDLFYGIWN